ncbi:MAG: hypothetical protein ACR2FV_09945 [Ornithinimicrobium sp.]|uniref:hypothetical protein n=1 Tax=Ornithinimicrobium sp. TaxID=1977084 RepID=UPI0017C39744|nr:hypothetical protein [Actinomycetota bacterium]
MVAERPDPPPRAPSPGYRPQPVPRAVRRGDDEVQFGLDPDRGIVLGGLSETEAAWLVSLSGHLTEAGLTRSGARWGVDPGRLSELVDLFRAHGLVVPDHVDRERHTGRVVVQGTGPVPALLRGQLRRCGVGQVEPAFLAGRPPDLVVLVAADAVPAHESRCWAGSGVMHLPVLIRGERGLVGPLAGRPGDPCLICLDLLRRDQDAGWPRLLSQLSAQGPEAHAPVCADPALATMLAGVVAMLVRAHLDNLPVPAGVTWEMALPSPAITARRWSVHPLCPAHSPSLGQAATELLRGRPRGRLRGTTTPASTS